MSKAALVEAIVRNGNGMITKAAAGRAIDSIGQAVVAGIAAHGRFALPGVGTFAVRQGGPRESRNARTGAKIQIPAGKRVQFVETNELKAAAANAKGAA